MSARSAAVTALLAAGLAAGCGSGSGEADGEAQKVVQQLRSLKKGEILIQGTSAPRVVGPYEFKRGGYLFSFEQEPADRKLTVALESRPRTRVRPYALLADSKRARGSTPISLSGKLYVHIMDAGGEYVLRFRPNKP